MVLKWCIDLVALYKYEHGVYVTQAFRQTKLYSVLLYCILLKVMSHEAICPCNLQCNFCRKKYCRLQLGCQTYATCFTTCNEIIFYARRVFKNVSGIWLRRVVIGSFSKNCETSCSGGVTRCNLSRSIVKSRSCFYFLWNLQRNFSLRD